MELMLSFGMSAEISSTKVVGLQSCKVGSFCCDDENHPLFLCQLTPPSLTGTGTGDESPVDGVVLVYNPESATHDTEVGLWYDQFVKNAGIPDSKCLVFVHRVDPKGGYRSRPPPKLEGETH